MRIHTNTLTRRDLLDAAEVARVTFTRDSAHNSKTRDHAFDVILSGESRRRQNGGSDFAATWDQWGVFLAILFDRDPTMVTPYYADRATFHNRTGRRFARRMGPVGVTYWPADAHGDHTFRYAGRPFEQSCTKCSAVQRWS